MKFNLLTYTFALSLALHTGSFAQSANNPNTPPTSTYYTLKYPKKVEHLVLKGNQADLANLGKLTQLKSLDLSGSDVRADYPMWVHDNLNKAGQNLDNFGKDAGTAPSWIP